MLVSDAFPSEYLRATDLKNRNVVVVISHVEMREVGDDHKPVVFFQGKEKGLVCNKTNANNIAGLYGDDTEDWAGKEVVLYPTMVDFQGRSVSAIRVRATQAKDRPKAAEQDPPTESKARPASADMKDEIPF